MYNAKIRNPIGKLLLLSSANVAVVIARKTCLDATISIFVISLAKMMAFNA